MKKLFTLILTAFISLGFVTTPVFAECPEGSVPVSIIGNDENAVTGTKGEKCVKDNGDGSGIINVLNLVVDIMTIGIAILAILGIAIAGIQYLSAGGSEEKVRKSKTRISEIIIGLAIYAVIYALLKWLLPSFGS